VVTSEIKLKQNNFVSVLFQTWLHVKLENKCIVAERQCNTGKKQTLPGLQCIDRPETVYFLQLLLQGAPKTAENRGKNCQKYVV